MALDLQLGQRVASKGGSFGMFRRTVSVDPPSIGAVAAANVDVTVPGAAVGDDVIAIPPATLEAGLAVQGATVSAANTVRIRLTNASAGAIDGAALTWTLIIFDRTPLI